MPYTGHPRAGRHQDRQCRSRYFARPRQYPNQPRAEALLFNAARAQIVDEVITPALTSGKVVLCDRYADSTLAYQGYGHGQALEPLQQLAVYATGSLVPDLTIFLDIDPREGLRRKQLSALEEWNRMEEQALAFHQAVRQGYLLLANAAKDRWQIIDAGQGIETIHQAILQRVRALCLDCGQDPL